jgi:hypothetical protein
MRPAELAESLFPKKNGASLNSRNPFNSDLAVAAKISCFASLGHIFLQCLNLLNQFQKKGFANSANFESSTQRNHSTRQKPQYDSRMCFMRQPAGDKLLHTLEPGIRNYV